MSLKVLLWIGWISYQGKRQHESFATLDGVEVMYDQSGEPFHGDTTEAAPSMKDQCMQKSRLHGHTGHRMASWREISFSLRIHLQI